MSEVDCGAEELAANLEESVLILGPDLSDQSIEDKSGFSRMDLAQELATLCKYPGSDLSLPKVSQYFEIVRGRHELLEYVLKKANDPNLISTKVHQIIPQLPIKVVITTNYDRLLEQELEIRKRPYSRVISNEDVAFI